MLASRPLCHNGIVEVFHKDHIASITKGMSLLEVKVLAGIVNLMVQQSNFVSGFLVVVRTLLFSAKSTLQQFQLALQTFKKLGGQYLNAITCCQKLFQTNIHANRMSVRDWVRNADIALQSNRGVPSISLLYNAYLLDYETIRNRAMQVDSDCPKFWQEQARFLYRRLLELGKEQGLELPKLLKAWEAMPKFLKSLPASMQLLNNLLQHLAWYLTQSRKVLFGIWQSVKLIDFGGKFLSRRHDVLMMDRTSIYQTLSAIDQSFSCRNP